MGLSSILTLASLGLIGVLAFMLLVLLNGVSSRDADPILLGFGGCALVGHLLIVSALTLLIGRRWHPRLTFWRVVPVTLAGLGLAGLILWGVVVRSTP